MAKVFPRLTIKPAEGQLPPLAKYLRFYLDDMDITPYVASFKFYTGINEPNTITITLRADIDMENVPVIIRHGGIGTLK